MIKGGASKKTAAKKSVSKSPASKKPVSRSASRKSRGTPVEDALRFKPFKDAPKSLDVSGSKHNMNGKWHLLKSMSKGNYNIHVYAMDAGKGPFLAIIQGGYADKATGAWREKWFWSITQSNPLEGDLVKKYLESNFWSPPDMLNGGLLKGSHVYNFEFREVRDKVKYDDSRDIRIKAGGRWKRTSSYPSRGSRRSGGRKGSKRGGSKRGNGCVCVGGRKKSRRSSGKHSRRRSRKH